MAISGTEPVSVDNLAAAIGAEVVGTDEFGQQPICVDNLKAVLEASAGPSEVVLYKSFYGAKSGTLYDDLSKYTGVMHVMGGYGDNIMEMQQNYYPCSGGSYSDGVLTIDGTSFRVASSSNKRVRIILARR